jgi:hypothetical protein
MSAVDRMAVRTRSGEYRSLPRRQALALIAAGRAEADKGSRLAEPIRQPDPVEITGTPEAIATKMDELAPINPYDLGQLAGVDDSAASPNDTPTPPDEHDPELEERRRALGLQPGEWMAERGGIKYPPLQPIDATPDDDVPTVEAVPLPPEPKPSARRGEWADYADSLGVEVTSAMTKREIQQAAEEAAQSLTNLPQPALTGGRLETPEDEPATETVADDQDPRTR